MSRFYFHVCNGDNVATDDEGTECANIDAARELALASARELVADAVKFARPAPDSLVIADADGQEVMTVPAKDALPENLCNE